MASCAFAGANFTYPQFQAFDDNGDPLSGGKLYTYISGTTTAKSTYTDATLSTANANPVVLDSRGEAEVYGEGRYKFVLKTSAGTTIWSMDPVFGEGGGFNNFYYLDHLISDHGASSGDTLKTLATSLGTSKYAMIVFGHDPSSGNTTAYNLDTSLDLSSYTNLYFYFQPGAYLNEVTGDETLTIYRKSRILNQPGDAQYNTESTLSYSENGAVYYDSTDSITFLGGVGAASRYSALKVTMSGSGKDGIYADSINQEAVLGRSTYGTGIYGIHSSAGAGGPGVFGSSNGTFGVYGWSRGDTGGTTSAGVYGESVDSIGGYFYADDNIGCQGHAGVYEAGRFIRQGGPTTQVTGTGGVAKYIHDHNVNLRPVVEIMKDTEPQLKKDNNRNDHSPVLFVNDMTDIADDDTSIGEQELVLDVRHGDDTRVGGHSKQTLDNEAAVNKGGGLVGIQLDGHGYSAGNRIVIRGTVEYDDVYTVDATTTANEIVVAATYWPETIPATATVSLARERKLFNIDETGVQTSRRKTYATNTMIGDTGVKYWVYCADVADDGTVALPDASHGHGMASAGGEVITFTVASDGSVKGGNAEGSGTTNTDDANTDATLCVYDAGTYAYVRNRLGSELQVLITYWYEE